MLRARWLGCRHRSPASAGWLVVLLLCWGGSSDAGVRAAGLSFSELAGLQLMPAAAAGRHPGIIRGPLPRRLSQQQQQQQQPQQPQPQPQEQPQQQQQQQQPQSFEVLITPCDAYNPNVAVGCPQLALVQAVLQSWGPGTSSAIFICCRKTPPVTSAAVASWLGVSASVSSVINDYGCSPAGSLVITIDDKLAPVGARLDDVRKGGCGGGTNMFLAAAVGDLAAGQQGRRRRRRR